MAPGDPGVWLLVAAGVLGLVPAEVARRKGYSWFVWWVCGAAALALVFPLILWMPRRAGYAGPPFTRRHGLLATAALVATFGLLSLVIPEDGPPGLPARRSQAFP